MNNTWTEVKVSDVARVVGGSTPSTSEEKYWNGDIPWLTPKDLSDRPSRFTSGGSRYISREGLDSCSAALVPAGTVLLTSRAPIGYVSIAKQPLTTNQGFKNLIVNSNQDPLFWYYLLRGSKDYLESQANGSTFKEISGSVLKNLYFKVPGLEEQRRIAGILGSLDDLIEVNRALIKDLESLAHTQFIQKLAELGDEVGTCSLASTVEIISGGTPKTSEPAFWGGAIPWFSVVDSPADSETWVLGTEKSITEAGLNGSAAKILPIGATILTARGTVGKTALVGVPMAINQSCYALRCLSGGPGYFNYYRVRSAIDSLRRMSHGSVFSTITRDTLGSVQVPDAPEDIIRAFDAQVDPYLKQIRALVHENTELASTRDELMPLLLSGRLRASKALAA